MRMFKSRHLCVRTKRRGFSSLRLSLLVWEAEVQLHAPHFGPGDSVGLQRCKNFMNHNVLRLCKA